MTEPKRTSDRRVRREIDVPVRRALAGVAGPLVVAVSGGPDSLALLLAARRVRDDLVVAHFNHGLRPDADADMEFVRGVARDLGCAFETATGDVRAVARRERRSIEDAARRLRYGFLAGVAGGAGATSVLVGHTADDQAESVLMHIIRGSGIRGLRGMSLVDSWPLGSSTLCVRRPLLGVRRARTAAYCHAMGLMPRDDAMNRDRRYTRTRVRLDVIPVLEAINPRVVEALGRLAEAARMVRPGDADGAPRTLLAAAGVVEPSSALIHAVERLGAAPPGRRIDAGGGVVLTRVAGGVATGEVRGARGGAPTPLREGTYAWGEWLIEVAPAAPGEGWEATLPHGELAVRTWEAGDRMTIGPGKSKKLQDLFVDAKVPRYDRGGWPVVCVDGRVAWLPGVRVGWPGEGGSAGVVVRVRRAGRRAGGERRNV